MDIITTLLMDGKVTHPGDLLSCRFTKDGEGIMTGSSDGVLKSINHSDLTVTGLFTDSQTESTSCPITSIQFSPFMEACLCTYAEGFIKYWDLSSGECVKTVTEENQILGSATSPLQHIFVTTADNGKLSVYDLETGSLRRFLERREGPDFADGHKSRVFAAKFHPANLNELVSGGWDKTVQFWDLRKPAAVKYIQGPLICGDSIDIDSTGQKVLTCSFEEENNLCIWDYSTAELMKDFTVDSSKNYCGAFMGPDYILTAGSSPSLLKIIDTSLWSVVGTYSTPLNGLYSMDFAELEGIQGYKIITVASHILIKMKFLTRKY